MEYSYIVRIRVRDEIYEDYNNWLLDHIEGNASRGIRGMIELRHQGRYLFPSVEVYTTDPVDGYRLMSVIYYTDELEKIEDYLEHYAPLMRGDMPADYKAHTEFNRYLLNGNGEQPIGKVNENMAEEFRKHQDKFYNLASFEVY